MSQLGERLRTAREQQGISLSQAAAETRILQRYLVALEEGDYVNLPGDVYARGFIRNYARLLGLPAEELIELYRSDRGRSEPIKIVQATAAPRIRGFSLPSFFGVFFVVLMLVGVSYLVLNATSSIAIGTGVSGVATITPTNAPTPPPLPTAPPAPTDAPQLSSGPVIAPTIGPAGFAPVSVPTTVPEPTAQSEAPIILEVRTDSGDSPGSWLQIKADGKTVFQKVLGPGQSVRYTAQRDVWIRAGNASVVSLTINGQPQPPLSTTPGEVVTFSWPP
jgi:cytoskeletal protein RodZ